MEAYNPIKPDIDTEYAKNYNEVKFNRLKIGMDSTKVIEEIGYPIYIRNLKENIQLWYYTRDNKCKGLNFAWLLRAIEIDENGKILSVKKAIVYD